MLAHLCWFLMELSLGLSKILHGSYYFPCISPYLFMRVAVVKGRSQVSASSPPMSALKNNGMTNQATKSLASNIKEVGI